MKTLKRGTKVNEGERMGVKMWNVSAASSDFLLQPSAKPVSLLNGVKQVVVF